MTKHNAIHNAALAALAAAGLWLLSFAPAARAQVVADDVQCSQCVGKGDIVDKSITAVKIKSNSIFSPKIQDRSIEGIDIAIGAVGTDEIADGGVTGADIAPGAIGQNEIAAGAIGRNEIARGVVGSREVLDESLTADDLGRKSVGESEIATDAVGRFEIRSNAVDSSKVLDESLTADDLAPNSVGQSELQANSVASEEVLDDGLWASDFLDEAGLDSDGLKESEQIQALDEVVRSVTITAPTAGNVIVMASGTFDETGNGPAVKVRCTITTGATLDLNVNPLIEAEVSADLDRVPFSGVRTFTVQSGSDTYNLVCDVLDAAITANVVDAQIVAIFAPTRY